MIRLNTVLVFIFAANAVVGCGSGPSGNPTAGAPHDSTVAAPTAEETASAIPSIVFRLTYEERQGRVYYQQYCQICHGESGAGDGFNAFNLDPRPRNFGDRKYMDALADDRLAEAIGEGGRGVNKSIQMPAWGDVLSPRQIRHVVAYIRLLEQIKPQ